MFDLQFEPTHEEASRARQEARNLLDAAGVPPGVAADIELVIAELTANAVDQRPIPPVTLDVAIVDGSILLTVANRTTSSELSGLSADHDPPRAHGALSETGRGLAIVQALTDEMWVDRDHGWTTVRCLRRFEPPTS